MELFAESRHEVVLAARSAFRFGTSACDELRRTHTLHVGFIFNPAGATVREGFIPVHAELVEKVKVNNPASLQAIGDEEREALEEAAQIQADHDAVALCFTISIFVKSAQSGEIKPVLTRTLPNLVIPITHYSTFIGYSSRKFDPDWAGTLVRWLSGSRRQQDVLVIEDLARCEGVHKAQQVVESARDKIWKSFREGRTGGIVPNPNILRFDLNLLEL